MTAGSVFGLSRMTHEIMDSKKDRGQCDIESENLIRAVLYTGSFGKQSNILVSSSLIN